MLSDRRRIIVENVGQQDVHLVPRSRHVSVHDVEPQEGEQAAVTLFWNELRDDLPPIEIKNIAGGAFTPLIVDTTSESGPYIQEAEITFSTTQVAPKIPKLENFSMLTVSMSINLLLPGDWIPQDLLTFIGPDDRLMRKSTDN